MGKPVYDQCSMFKLSYSSFSKEELAMRDRSSVPNNTEVVKCKRWTYDHSMIISNAVTKVNFQQQDKVSRRKKISVIFHFNFDVLSFIEGIPLFVLLGGQVRSIDNLTSKVTHIVLKLVSSASLIDTLNQITTCINSLRAWINSRI